MTVEKVFELAEMVGGQVEHVEALPDGSGFATMSMPLPKDHWIYKRGPDGFSLPPPMPFRMGINHPLRGEWHEKVREAAKYAIRGATMHGAENDFDPDALIQNLLVGLFGYHTTDGLCSEAWANPAEVPPLFGVSETVSEGSGRT